MPPTEPTERTTSGLIAEAREAAACCGHFVCLADSRKEHDGKALFRRLAAELERLQVERERRRVAEDALTRKGYRQSCDLPACNCGDQWTHGGRAREELAELLAERDRLRSALVEVWEHHCGFPHISRGETHDRLATRVEELAKEKP